MPLDLESLLNGEGNIEEVLERLKEIQNELDEYKEDIRLDKSLEVVFSRTIFELEYEKEILTLLGNHLANEKISGASTEYLLKNGAGSVGETARAYSNSYKNLNNIRTVNEDEFNNSFLTVINFRIVAYESIGIDGGNLLLPISVNGLKQIHTFFKEVEEFAKSNMLSSEYKDKSIEKRLDLPTMILYAMIQESDNKRKGFAEAGEQFNRRALKILYQEVKAVCPYQILISEEDFIEENVSLILAFINDIDSSIGDLIRMTNPK